MLEDDVTKKEIRKALFDMPLNKSQNPDGFPYEFFKAAWSILAHDFTTSV